ncbi:MAG: helix-turn-helix transcriptional regulator [Chloroflexi bacterium]|nr:helix-turn-helix transcriptional regulator [Chloroflexota bacterium]
MYLGDPRPSESRRVLGDLLRTARKRRGITQTRLEEWSGVDQTVISRIEAGKPIGLRIRTVLRLMDALGIIGLEATYARFHPWSDLPPFGPDEERALLAEADNRCRRCARDRRLTGSCQRRAEGGKASFGDRGWRGRRPVPGPDHASDVHRAGGHRLATEAGAAAGPSPARIMPGERARQSPS